MQLMRYAEMKISDFLGGGFETIYFGLVFFCHIRADMDSPGDGRPNHDIIQFARRSEAS